MEMNSCVDANNSKESKGSLHTFIFCMLWKQEVDDVLQSDSIKLSTRISNTAHAIRWYTQTYSIRSRSTELKTRCCAVCCESRAQAYECIRNPRERRRARLPEASRSLPAVIPLLHVPLSGAFLLTVECQPVQTRVSDIRAVSAVSIKHQ